MQRLFYFTALLAGAILCHSCSPARLHYKPLTQRPSQPWEGNSTSWGGYSEKALDTNRTKVTFETFNQPGPEFARYFVNVRAAELALASGTNTFWICDKKNKEWKEKSYFSDYIVPGYWSYREHEIIHCRKHCKKKCRAHIEIIRERFWVPERYVPPHTSVNLLSKAEVIISKQPTGTPLHATHIINDALSNRHGFGKPRLSRYTMHAYKTYMTKTHHR